MSPLDVVVSCNKCHFVMSDGSGVHGEYWYLNYTLESPFYPMQTVTEQLVLCTKCRDTVTPEITYLMGLGGLTLERR